MRTADDRIKRSKGAQHTLSRKTSNYEQRLQSKRRRAADKAAAGD